jgi:membrane protein
MALVILWPRRVIGEIVRRLRQHQFMLMAAGIAFYWLIGIIPLLLLGSSAVGYLVGSTDRGVDEIMVVLHRMIPRASARELEEFLRPLIHSRHVTGVLGIGFLLWVGIGTFEAIAGSLTTLCGDQETRSFFRRKFVALVMMGTAGLLLVSALLGNWILAAWQEIQYVIGARIELPAFLKAPGFPRYAATLLMAILLSTIYRVAPVRPIRWPWAIAGASVATLLWDQARRAFSWYLVHYARYNLFYGILGGFIGLVLWIYYTAVILLAGGLVADVMDRGGRGRRG